MRAVIYDPEDMEPLTVIEIPWRFMREIDSGERLPFLRFAIQPPINLMPRTSDAMPEMLQIAEVRFERFLRHGKKHWMVFAMNPEICLLMKSVLLAGQQRDVQAREKKAYYNGILDALTGAFGH